MSDETCFVIMAIGDQDIDGQHFSYSNLKEKYDNLIKEAIVKARPNMEVTRADEVSLPGTITTDIITRIMHSRFVVADVTFPNPNVFYELGLRHACKAGTIIIKDKSGPKVPFDIAHLRYIEYENTTTGLKELAEKLRMFFAHYDKSPDRPDNHLLELAKLTGYTFPNYNKDGEIEPETKLMMSLLESPALIELFLKQQSGEDVDQSEIFRAIMTNPSVAQPFLNAMVKSGELSLLPNKKPATQKRRK